jgi:ribosomal protein L11
MLLSLSLSLSVSHEADIMTAAVFAIAKQQRVSGRSQAAAFVGTVKEVLGSCHSLGITVDGTTTTTTRRQHMLGHDS